MRKTYLSFQLLGTLLILVSVTSAVNGQSYTPLYGIHTDLGLVLGYDSFDDFVQVISSKGYSSIMYMIATAIPDTLNGYADYRFVSPTLQRLGWTFVSDELADLMAAADNYDVDVYVDLQGLAYVALDPQNYPLVTPPSTNDVVNIVYEVADYGVVGISEEMFSAEWFAPAYQACQDSGLTYIHKAIDWDFGAMSQYWNHTVFETYPNCDVVMTEDYEWAMDPPLMAANEQFPSIAEWLAKEYYVKVSASEWALRSIANMENVILSKAIQVRPAYIYMMTWSKEHVDSFDLANMTNLIEEYVSEEAKPICNIVLYLTGDETPDIWDWWSFPASLAPLSTGIKASGYDIITTPAPIDSADMYYVFTRGVWGDWGNPPLDLPQSIVELFDSGKPVFLQLTQKLPNNTVNWNIVRARLGIDGTAFETIPNGDGVLYGTYNGIEYAHLSDTSYLNDIRPENVVPPGEVVSTGTLNDTTYALIIKSGNNYFVNGFRLDLRASFPVSNLINDGLQKPAACVVTTGNTSVFYALDVTDSQFDTTELHIRLPNPSITQVRWFKRDFNGVTSSGIASYDPTSGYIDMLSEGTILVLKAQTVGSPDYPSDFEMSAVQLDPARPNPFTHSTTIRYCLTRRQGDAGRGGGLSTYERINLCVYDLAGRLVRALVDGEKEPGSYRVVWDGKDADGKDVGSGVYFAVLNANKIQRESKLVLVR